MQKTGASDTKTAHRTVKSSTTLDRKYIKRPVASKAAIVAQSPKEKAAADLKRRQEIAERMNRENNARLAATRRGYVEAKKTAEKLVAKTASTAKPEEKIKAFTPHPLQTSVNQKIRKTADPLVQKKALTAQELKNRAITQALKAAEKPPVEKKTKTKKVKKHISVVRIVLAFSCAAISIAAIAYLIKVNVPDLSLKVTAIQTGVEASYPSFTPYGFKTSEISSSNGKITITFHSEEKNTYFTLTEENSTWDSSALLTNYVQDNLSEDYTIIREQGLTIYLDNNNATWVNGGIVYKLNFENDVLTTKQVKMIAVSL